MAKGGSRPGSGRKPKSIHEHLLRGTFRRSRHALRLAAGATAAAPEAQWCPAPADVQGLSPRGVTWLTTALDAYTFTPLNALRLLELARTVSRIEQIEAAGASSALVREHRLLLLQFSALQLEK